jgi:hypothetical protein
MVKIADAVHPSVDQRQGILVRRSLYRLRDKQKALLDNKKGKEQPLHVDIFGLCGLIQLQQISIPGTENRFQSIVWSSRWKISVESIENNYMRLIKLCTSCLGPEIRGFPLPGP